MNNKTTTFDGKSSVRDSEILLKKKRYSKKVKSKKIALMKDDKRYGA